MAGDAPVCKCEELGDPLCGFCQDDQYCPQCGSQITSVYCEDAQGDRGAVWVYPQRGSEKFVFSLSLLCRGQDRSVRHSLPDLDLDNSHVDVPGWFESRIECLGPRGDERAMQYCLLPRTDAGQQARQLANRLPIEGVRAQLTAMGGFRPQQFDLRICRAPAIQVRIHGDGILDSAGDDRKTWRIWKREPLSLTLEIEALSAPCYLTDDVSLSTDGTFAARLENPLRKGRELTPNARLSAPANEGDADAMRLVIDSSTWPIDGKKELTIRVPLGAWGLVQERVTLQVVAMGDLKYSCGERLLFEGKHFGDREARTISVENVGDEAIWATVPLPDTLPPWLRVQWAAAPVNFEPLPLAPGDKYDLEVQIDLGGVRQGDLPADGELKAVIKMGDDVRSWPLTIRVPHIIQRPDADDRWLAIDFGSTNTYVGERRLAEVRPLAIRRRQSEPEPAVQVAPVLVPDPEKFSTALYFEDVSNPERPRFVIGPAAVKRGEAFPLALASGLKRWIGVVPEDGRTRHWYITDPNGQERDFDVATLTRLFLREVIRQCDDRLKKRVCKIGLSFPANFDRSRIQALEQILQNLADEMAQETPPRQLTVDPPRLDEATAVALGFGLARTAHDEAPPAAGQKGRSLVVGSFDFGGGTIDTAVIRLRFHGPSLDFARYESEYLGIGGDETFGGENVTLAIVELLLDRICLAARERKAAAAQTCQLESIPLERPGEGHSELARKNFDALWAAAEAMKMHLCAASHPPGEAAPKSAAADTVPATVAVPEPAAAETVADTVAEATAGGAAKPPAVAPIASPLLSHLSACLGKLQGTFVAASGNFTQPLMQDAGARAALEAALEAGGLTLCLDDIYQHRVRRDLQGASPYSIVERLEFCVDEMLENAERHNEKIDHVILAGAAARLPIVYELLKTKLQGSEIHFDRQHPKSKVAEGLIRFLDLRESSPARVEKIRSPLDHNPHELGLWEPGRGRFKTILPACSPFLRGRAQAWFPLSDVPVQAAWDSRRAIKLYALRRGMPHLVGYFDLSQPGEAAAHQDAGPSTAVGDLPAELGDYCTLALRFTTGPEHFELKVRDEETGVDYGYWPLRAAD